MLRASSLDLSHILRRKLTCRVHLARLRTHTSVEGRWERVSLVEEDGRFNVVHGLRPQEDRRMETPPPTSSKPGRPIHKLLTYKDPGGRGWRAPSNREGMSGWKMGNGTHILDLGGKTDAVEDLTDTHDIEKMLTEHHASSEDLQPKLHDPAARSNLLYVLAKTESVNDAWSAYRILSAMPYHPNTPTHAPKIPYQHLHRLVRLLAAAERTRTLFLHLLSVLSTLRRSGGRIKLWEWNLLIDCAGKGWRRTRQEDFRRALDVYGDMLEGEMPGTSLYNSSEEAGKAEDTYAEDRTPDIVTFTTLLAIAVRTLEPPALRHASILLSRSGIRPNIVSYTALLGYFARRNELAGVRETLSKMSRKQVRMNRVAFNAVLWAFAYNSRMDIARTMYRIVRHNSVPEEDEEGVQVAVEWLHAKETFTIPDAITPDKITYHMLIQAHAYYGDFVHCLQVFTDMLTSPVADTDDEEAYIPTLAAFRSIFLGFFRHGVSPKHGDLTTRLSLFSDVPNPQAWSLKNLELLFERFLELPETVSPRPNLVYWIIVAFMKTSDNDKDKLHEVFELLDGRFGRRWDARIERLRERIYRGDSNGISQIINNINH